MSIKIALAGNPNSGKTTLFNALTGSNQFVGNWPGVTVEKKEGKLKKNGDVVITDLPGIYSLSPYTLEEVVARNYLIGERPDAILNIIDGTNLERNLYLTTQLTELGIPVVAAVNMCDVLKKNGDTIDLSKLSEAIGCKTVAISALKGEGVKEAAEAAIEAAKSHAAAPRHRFSGAVEHALAHIEEAALHEMSKERQRWYAIKLFERDEKAAAQLDLSENIINHIENDIKAVEEELDDDSESIITNERYDYISRIIGDCQKKKDQGKLSTSDKVDKVVTNRVLGLPIFAAVMFLIYYLAMVTVGLGATDWANDGLFGDGYHLFGIGSAETAEAEEEYGDTDAVIDGALAYAEERGIDVSAAEDAEGMRAVAAEMGAGAEFTYTLEDEETLETETLTATGADFSEAIDMYEKYDGGVDPANYGVWVPGVPVLIEGLLGEDCPEWLHGLVIDGIVAGVGAVLGFVPQMLVLFLLLAIVEACGYMARVAFVLDRIFRRFGLSGKSFIPILIGTGCGIPGIMASRTIENERDRRMTIMTTTFIPCSAKLPFIAMIAGAIFGGSPVIAVSAFFLGMAAIIISGIILKKTKMFAGDPAPFVMELPAYHMPTVGNVLRSMWERGWSFIKKAGTIILLSTIVIWFATYFGFVDGAFGMLDESEIEHSILAAVGGAISWIFAPIGFGNWQAAVASITGLVAKENIVGTLGILYGGGEGSVYQAIAAAFTPVAGYAFLAFNLLCAPCFAAIGAIKREMNNRKWTWFAIGYQCGFAYAVSFVIYQIGSLFSGPVSALNIVGAVIAAAVIVFAVYLLFRPYKEPKTLTQKVMV
ncbi:MAG: ferrous iron transporter B [Clostridia bacterium]|nr:ferrous iron transporter B [Clostridia bacterium]